MIESMVLLSPGSRVEEEFQVQGRPLHTDYKYITILIFLIINFISASFNNKLRDVKDDNFSKMFG